MTILERINGPRDLDALSLLELETLATEIRELLVSSVANTGGHLGPNLGVVETTIAIHRVFESPKDPIIFDTGHQSYVHKILTGRKNLESLRKKNGLAGYPQRSESVHDVVESSHASSSLSWADGIAKAFKISGEDDRYVVALLGDGALTGGMTWEALNNISFENDRKLVIVVNDNGRSYAPTVGGLSKHLNVIRADINYKRMYRFSKKVFYKFGFLGRMVFNAARSAGKSVLESMAPATMYPNLDIKYIGPIDGHSIEDLERALQLAKGYSSPVIVHVITQKGKGFDPAMLDVNDQFHAIGKFNPATGESLEVSEGPSWTHVFRDEMVRLADARPDIVGITGAMTIPVGLDAMATKYPNRVFDVGIAEQHAVASAAGMAFGGLHPVVAVYATFINRAFDQVLMDVALHKAGVTFVLDRAGVTGPDGASHHGMWDLSVLQVIPTIRIAAPRDAARLREELNEAVNVADAPTVIRFPKGVAAESIAALKRSKDGVDYLFESSSKDVLIVAIGSMATLALQTAELLKAQGIGATIIDPRWVVPVPKTVLDEASKHRLVVTIEDGVKVGGIGTRIRQDMRTAQIDTALNEVGLPDEFLEHASRDEILNRVGLTAKQVAHDIVAQVLGAKVPHARKLQEFPEQSVTEPK